VGKIRRGQVYLANFDGIGSEVKKPRPCVVVSPDTSNARAATFIAVLLTTQDRPYPTRIRLEFNERACFAMLDQIQVSPLRVISLLGQLGPADLNRVLDRLQELFAP
jgi:mRNA interferase MazF